MSAANPLSDPGEGWLSGAAPSAAMVVSTRGRLARNLVGEPFVPHAAPDALRRVQELVVGTFSRVADLHEFERIDIASLSLEQRSLLKEDRLISQEMERLGEGRTVMVARDRRASVMVNEEDHLRLQCIEPGLQLERTIKRLELLEQSLAGGLAFAFSQKYGYLTACPTNVGTGLRASVMLHLPGLVLRREVETALAPLPNYGLTVRGFNGENTEFVGDFFQISNEVTLGRTVASIVAKLRDVLRVVMEREEEARAAIAKERSSPIEDALWRSYGVLRYARRLELAECMRLLSRLRLGIDRGYFPGLTHEGLNRLCIAVQPAHLMRMGTLGKEPPNLDEARGHLVRQCLGSLGPGDSN